jgi:hypothetical protein
MEATMSRDPTVEEEHVGDLPNAPDCGARGEFMPTCGQMEGKDSCWACGRTHAEHDAARAKEQRTAPMTDDLLERAAEAMWLAQEAEGRARGSTAPCRPWATLAEPSRNLYRANAHAAHAVYAERIAALESALRKCVDALERYVDTGRTYYVCRGISFHNPETCSSRPCERDRALAAARELLP